MNINKERHLEIEKEVIRRSKASRAFRYEAENLFLDLFRKKTSVYLVGKAVHDSQQELDEAVAKAMKHFGSFSKPVETDKQIIFLGKMKDPHSGWKRLFVVDEQVRKAIRGLAGQC